MGRLALAAKITHVPSMYPSELPGKYQGRRESAIRGHREIGARCRALGVDTIVVFDVHWLVNAGYHVKCAPTSKGVYTSNELPHFIRNIPYEYAGDPALGHLIAETATAHGVPTRAHDQGTLELEYGRLVPMRYMNEDRHFCVVSIAAWCAWQDHLQDSRRLGAAVLGSIGRSDSAVAVLASGSLSHFFNDKGSPEESIHEISREFRRQVGLRLVDLWHAGDFRTFCAMLPEYATLCHGEGGMYDTAMPLGMLGRDAYDRPVEIVTDHFASSGTGQVNAVFPLA
jgi:3,4-dihydroxyphenylacetate 2,3-dioxygenase